MDPPIWSLPTNPPCHKTNFDDHLFPHPLTSDPDHLPPTSQTASKILRQLFLGQTDLQLHEYFDPDSADNDPFAVMRHVAEQTLPVTPLDGDRFLCSFGHIFAGSYAAGYYSYKWAEVLSADAFSLFRENGLETRAQLRKSGLRYRDTILALGGSMHPDTLYKKFRGRPPTTEALLQEYGLS